jgi:hypothetical protein
MDKVQNPNNTVVRAPSESLRLCFSGSWILLTYGSGDEDQKDETCKLAKRVQILITCMEEKDNVNVIIEFSCVHMETHSSLQVFS